MNNIRINNKMKFLALIFFIIGVVYSVMGFISLEDSESEKSKRIEYRFVPRTVYDELGIMEVTTNYSDLFDEGRVIYDRRNVPTNLV